MVSINTTKHVPPARALVRSQSAAAGLAATPAKKMAAMTASDPDLAKQLYHANVRLAIDDRVSGTGAKFEELRAVFSSADTSPAELCQYLAAMTHFVTRLEAPTYTPLVRAILSMHWLVYPAALTQVYVQFIAALATAQTTFLPLMLSSLLREFSDVTPSPAGKRTELQLGAHWAIQHLLNAVPSGHTILLRLIKETFPHKSAERREQISYVLNMIRLGEYVEHLKGDILALCIERVVQVDVEIQYELDRLEDELEEELLLGHYDGTPYSPEDDINTEPSLEADEVASSALLDTSTSLAMMRDTITTLDALMTTLFKYIDPLFPQTTDDVPSLHTEHLFDSLIRVFSTSILPTYHSRHAQFFIFRTAQSHAHFLDKFLGLLIERSLDPSLPNITRQASSAYLASFIARAKELSPDTIRTVVEMLCVFLGRVLDDCPAGKFVPGGLAGNQGLEGVYAIFQAVIYIYCFRWRELFDEHPETADVIWIPQLNVIQRMAWSGLNPLAHISQDVAQEFAQRSYQLQHFYVHSILKENARKGLVVGFLQPEVTFRRDLAETSDGEMVEIRVGRVDTSVAETSVPRDWYPFDPYALPRSKGFVVDCFLEYRPMDVDDEDMDTDDNGDSSEDMDDDSESDEDENEEDY